MRSRPFGRLPFEVSEMALGTWGLSGDAYGPAYEEDLGRVVEAAVELGITLFETADVYGRGAMERLLADHLDPTATRVVTKLGTCLDEEARSATKRFDRETLRVALEKSRERLRREVVDVVLLHNPGVADLEESSGIDFLREEVEAGRILGWGVSAGSAEVARAAVDRCANVIEIAYNFFTARQLHGLTDALASTDTAVLARSVLAHGLLAGHWSPNKTFYEHDHRSRRWTQDGLRYRISQLQAVRRLIGGKILTMRAAAVRFVLSNQLVSSAVLGVRSVTQLKQLVREAGDGPPYLDEETLLQLPEIMRLADIEL